MADSNQHSKAIFNRLGSDNSRHLRPLSIYSRLITCDTTNVGACDSLSSPCNIKIKIINNCSVSGERKRQLDDSCLDETYETPQKKPCLSECHSPDLACVLDSPLAEEKNGALECSIVEERVNKVANGNINNCTDTENTFEPEGPPLVQPTCLVLTDSSNECDGRSSPLHSFSNIQSSSPLTHTSEEIGHQGPVFFFDFKEIVTLSPISCNVGLPNSDGREGFLQSGRRNDEACNGQDSFHKHQSSEQPPGKTEGHEGGRNTGSENDEGYLTKSFKSAEESKNLTPADVVTPVISTPLDKFRQLVKRSPILKRLGKLGQSFPALNLSLETENASSPISLYGSMNLDGMNGKIDGEIPFLDSNENIESKFRSVNDAIQKSLVCHKEEQVPVVTDIVKLVKEAKTVPPLRAPVVTVTDTVKQVKEPKDVPPVSQQVNPKFKVTFREEVSSSTTLESAPPLQVMSKVVAFSIQRRDEKAKSAVKPPAAAFASPSNTTAASQEPDRKSQSDHKRKVPGEVQRPLVFHREEDWDRHRKVYVDSVVRHMQDNRGNGNGVMNELFHLMDTVASQGNQREGKQWQHPSDLTCRNYQPRNKGSLLSLDEWQNLNCRHQRRFAQVPNPFKRSPLP